MSSCDGDAVVFTIRNEAGTPVEYTVDGKSFTIQPRYTVTQQRCRPPAVTFHLPGETGTAPAYHPHPGDHFVIEGNGPGEYRVVEE